MWNDDLANCSKTMLEKYILPMMQTVQRPNLKHLLLWCCKLVKEPTWKVCTVDVTNCSKTLLGNCIMLMLQSVKRTCLNYVSPNLSSCSKALLRNCILLMVMLQTVQRPYLGNVLCWCCKLIKDHACKIYSSDDANWSKTLLDTFAPLMLQIVQRTYLKCVFCWCY